MRISSLAISIFTVAIMLSACSPKTEPFNYGKDNCYFCKMGIVDPKYGGEVITKKSKVYKFDDVICMIRYLQSGTLTNNEIAKKVVINFDQQDANGKNENDFLDVNTVIFWVSPELRSPMGSNAAAFVSQQTAENAKAGKEGLLMNWDEIYKKIK